MEGFDFNHIFIYWAENINFSKSHLLQIDKLVKLQDFFSQNDWKVFIDNIF